MSRDIATLHSCMRDVAVEFVSKCAERGLMVVITQTHRTDAEQQALYDQGRVRPGKIVTNAKPGQSPHNPDGCPFGLAFDIAFLQPETGGITWEEPRPGGWGGAGGGGGDWGKPRLRRGGEVAWISR